MYIVRLWNGRACDHRYVGDGVHRRWEGVGWDEYVASPCRLTDMQVVRRWYTCGSTGLTGLSLDSGFGGGGMAIPTCRSARQSALISVNNPTSASALALVQDAILVSQVTQVCTKLTAFISRACEALGRGIRKA